MPGLLDLDPEVLAMLSRGGAGGSLLTGAQPQGLLAGFQPGPNEGLSDRIFGTNDPRDPRGPMMMGLASGLVRGSFATGLDNAQRAIYDTEDRSARRQAQGLAMTKDVLSLNELVRRQREDSQSRDVLQQYWRNRGVVGGGAPGSSVGGLDGPQFNQGVDNGPGPAMGTLSGFGGSQNGAGMVRGPAAQSGSMQQAPAQGSQGMVQGMSQGGVPPKVDVYGQYRQLGDAFAAQGLGAKAQQYYELAEKYRPKFSQTPQLMKDPATGKLVQVLISDDGSTQVLPFGAKPDVSLENLGGRTMAIDKNAVRDRETFDRTMTPGEVASNRVALGNLSVAQQRLAMDANAPDYHPDGNGGFYALPKRPTPGAPIIGQPVTGPDGQPLGANAPPKLTEFQGKATTFATRMIDATKTLDEVGGKVSPSRIAQAGYRAEIPGWMPGGQIVGAGLTAANQLMTPDDAQRYRAAQENWVTANLRQESGAAIGKDEMEKDVRKYFPQPGESAAVISQKEMTRRKAQEAMVAQAGPGAKLIAGINAKAQDAQRSADSARQQPASALPALPTPNGSNQGKKYRDTQTGKVYQSNGMQWKEVQ